MKQSGDTRMEDGTKATSRGLHGWFVTGSSGGLLPSDGSVRTVKAEWMKQAGDWLVISAQWEHE